MRAYFYHYRLLPIIGLFLLFCFGPVSAWAYSVGIHYRLPVALSYDRANGVDRKAAMPDDARLQEFRLQVYDVFAATRTEHLGERFLAVFPTPESFDSQAFKEFFGMAATHPALGFDASKEVSAAAGQWRGEESRIGEGDERSLLEWVQLGSIYPDLDFRNRGRWLREDDEFAVTAGGERIPFDPAVLNMGRVEELSGQAHAHYGLNNHPKSQDAKVLKERPADFAVPIGFDGPVLTFAPQRAQAYGDLAVLAAHFGLPALAAIHAGHAFHYLADVGNQIHTVQVGTYDFFVDATLQSFKEKVRCLWGLRCHPLTRNEIGVDIIGNHHTWSEEFFRIALERAEEGRPLHTSLADVESLYRPDEKLGTAWRSHLTSSERSAYVLQTLAEEVILAGNEEAPRIYELTRKLTIAPMRKAGYTVAFEEAGDEIVLQHLKKKTADNLIKEFLDLESRGLVRAATAMDLWWKKYLAPEAKADWALAAERILRLQLAEWEDARARRAQWLGGQPQVD